jgi:hypothetical protein
VTFKVDEAFIAPGGESGDIDVIVADSHTDVRVRRERGKLFQEFVSHHQI